MPEKTARFEGVDIGRAQWFALVESALGQELVNGNLYTLGRDFRRGRAPDQAVGIILGRKLRNREKRAMISKFRELEAAGKFGPVVTKFAPCPRCGGRSGFLVKLRARGRAENHFDLDGEFIETGTDKMWFEPISEAVRCLDCLRIRPDVRRDSERIVPVEAG